MPDSSTSRPSGRGSPSAALTTSNQPTDEFLISAFLSGGNENAFDELYQRYYNPIGFYIKKHSIYRDPSFIDDVREIIFLKVFTALKQGRFQPKFPGSFKKYLFDVALKTIFDENEKRLRIVRPVSEIFTEEELETPDALSYREPEDTDYELIEERAKEVMAKLNKKEQRLVQLAFIEQMPYEKIITLPEFKNIKSVDTLKNKIYRIKQKLNPRGGRGGKDNGK